MVARKLQRAMLYITALGLYEARINGEKVGNHLLAPEFTDYRTRVQYQTYDVTRMFNGEMAAQSFLTAANYNVPLDPGLFDPHARPDKNKKKKH